MKTLGSSLFSCCGLRFLRADESHNERQRTESASKCCVFLQTTGGQTCLSAAGCCPHLHPAHPPLPPYFPAAKCHIHISCQLINLTAQREQGAILHPVRLQSFIFAPRHAFAPKLSNTAPTWATLTSFKVQEGTNATTLLAQLLFHRAQHWARMLHGHNSWAESWTWWMPWVWGGWY